MCRFLYVIGTTYANQRKVLVPSPKTRAHHNLLKALHRLQRLFLELRPQTVELPTFEANRVLAVAGFFSGHVPVRHPAELLAFIVLEHDQERIKCHFLFVFSQPGLQSMRKQSGKDGEFSVPTSKLEIQS